MCTLLANSSTCRGKHRAFYQLVQTVKHVDIYLFFTSSKWRLAKFEAMQVSSLARKQGVLKDSQRFCNGDTFNRSTFLLSGFFLHHLRRCKSLVVICRSSRLECTTTSSNLLILNFHQTGTVLKPIEYSMQVCIELIQSDSLMTF